MAGVSSRSEIPEPKTGGGSGRLSGLGVASKTMTYHHHRPALGAAETDTAKAALEIVRDPYLTEVTCQVLRLAALEDGTNPGPPCRQIPVVTGTRGMGVGLRYVVKPLRVVVAAREHPIIAAGTVLAVVSGIFLLGAALGGRRA